MSVDVPFEPLVRSTKPVHYYGAKLVYLELRMTDGSDEHDDGPSWSIWEVLDERRACLVESIDMTAMESHWTYWSTLPEYS